MLLCVSLNLANTLKDKLSTANAQMRALLLALLTHKAASPVSSLGSLPERMGKEEDIAIAPDTMY